MKFRFVFFGTCVLIAACRSLLADHPKVTIANNMVTAKMYLPDAKHGFYRGTRFDWSGVIYSLRFAGHEYFGEWQKSDDPNVLDRITGPVDGFGADGDSDKTFLRIGVGQCEKRKEGDTQWKHPYRITDPGKWSTKHGANWVEIVHQIDIAETGQGYHYVKRLSLPPGRPELVIDHVLTNTGRKPIATEVYNHNFFVIDGQPTGPDFTLQFPFPLTADRSLKGYGEVHDDQVRFAQEIPDGVDIIAFMTGYGTTEADHRFTLENRKTRAGVRMVADRPMSKLLFWAPRTTICPEPFIDLNIEADHADRWSIRYTFYTVEK